MSKIDSIQKDDHSNGVLPILKSSAYPTVTKKTDAIFREQDFKLPSSFYPLTIKVEELEHLVAKLQNAKQHPIRDKVISILAIVLVLCVIAGGVLGTYYGFLNRHDPLGFLACVATPFITVFVAAFLYAYYNQKWSDIKDEDALPVNSYLDFLKVVIMGPFIPLWKTFGNISRYEKLANQKRDQIIKDTEEIKKFVLANKENCKKLLLFLEEGIKQINNTIKNPQEWVKATLSDTKVSQLRKELEVAKKELEEIISFFS